MMVTPGEMSFTNKLLSRTDIIITKTRNLLYVKCNNIRIMSRQEIAKAVEQIQEAPPTDELAEL